MEPECATNPFKCEWKEVYYGHECIHCGEFIAHGCEPWMPIDDDNERYTEYDDAGYDWGESEAECVD